MKPSSNSPALDSKGSFSKSKPRWHGERNGGICRGLGRALPESEGYREIYKLDRCSLVYQRLCGASAVENVWEQMGGQQYTKQYLQGSIKNSKKTRKDDIYPSPL